MRGPVTAEPAGASASICISGKKSGLSWRARLWVPREERGRRKSPSAAAGTREKLLLPGKANGGRSGREGPISPFSLASNGPNWLSSQSSTVYLFVYVIAIFATQLRVRYPAMVSPAIGAPRLRPLLSKKLVNSDVKSASTRFQASLGSRKGSPRRLFLGLGASLLESFGKMASIPGSSTGSRPFTASARPQQGTSPVEKALINVEWPEKFPFKDEDFTRYDESPDTYFYSEPRFVTHIDDPAINALTKYYSSVLPPKNTPGVSLLDMCSSWISHYPAGYKQDRIVGMGLNDEELKRNTVLTEYVVQDLNVDPKLPFDDSTFDVITNVVSVDYLNKPLDVFQEMNRVLKPGGLAIMSFSNRCFWTKAISIWTSTGDVDHAWIVGSYFHYAGGYEPPVSVDISPNPGRSDPMYIVYSRKKSEA